jgi:hypothetical protein
MLSLLCSLTAFAAVTSAVAANAEVAPAAATKAKPNIVLIRELSPGHGDGHGDGHVPYNADPPYMYVVTDDQDKGTLSQARWLPRIHKYLVDEGVYYENFFAPVRSSRILGHLCLLMILLNQHQHRAAMSSTDVADPEPGLGLLPQ